MKLGVCIESLGLAFRKALPAASRLSLAALQADAAGELAPDQLTATAKREIRNLLTTYNLELAALNCPMRRGIDVVADQQPRLDYIKKAMQLAFDLGPRKVVVQCPKLPEDLLPASNQALHEALLDLGHFGDRVGVLVCLEIGFDSGERVRYFLAKYDVGSLQVTYDPANMLMNGQDPAKNIMPLVGRIAHFHARDARINSVSRPAGEVAVGAGDVEWMSLIGALTAIEYHGCLAIQRESGADLKEVEQSAGFLRRLVMPERIQSRGH